jgi:hypothetical protein
MGMKTTTRRRKERITQILRSYWHQPTPDPGCQRHVAVSCVIETFPWILVALIMIIMITVMNLLSFAKIHWLFVAQASKLLFDLLAAKLVVLWWREKNDDDNR